MTHLIVNGGVKCDSSAAFHISVKDVGKEGYETRLKGLALAIFMMCNVILYKSTQK